MVIASLKECYYIIKCISQSCFNMQIKASSMYRFGKFPLKAYKMQISRCDRVTEILTHFFYLLFNIERYA